MAEQPSIAGPYVFLSYASVEQDRALAVSDALQQAGIPVWLDRHAIAGGAAWSTAIVRGIKDCTAFVVLGSQRAFGSPNVQRELNLAVEENRPLLPLLLEQVTAPDDVRYALAGRQWVALLDRPTATWLPEVLRALAGLGLGPSTLATAAAQPPTETSRPLPEPAAVHLPAPLTSFIGREQELAAVISLLATSRLLTLTGPGGTGKTRLALAAASQVADRFPDGIWFVDLSGVADPAGVLPAIALVLEVRESEGRSLAVSLAAYLRRKQLLLVLDNLEQVVGSAMALYDLLAEAPGLSLLVTSRILLRVGGEQDYPVLPLPTPELIADIDLAALRENPAVQLFFERAHALRPDLVLSEEALRASGAICARLDGLPLAIELAAARVKLLSPGQLLARLERRLPLLTGGVRSLPQRQQTLRNTIQWSWDLLAPAEQTLFRRLGVFVGSFTLAAAEAICDAAGELAVAVLEVLAALVDQSLVRQREQEEEPRFSLLATLQEFALEQLESAGEGAALRRAHAEYYTTLAEEADAAWWHSGRLEQDFLRPMDLERDNLLGALGWALAEQDAAIGLRLGGPLGWWFSLRVPGEGQERLARLLELPEALAPGAARGRALNAVGTCALVRGELQAAAAYWEEAIICLRAEEGLPMLSRTLALLGTWSPSAAGDRPLALAEEALDLARAVGGTFNLAFVEVVAGQALLLHGGNLATARDHMDKGLRLARARGADFVTTVALTGLGRLAVEDGHLEEARALFEEALALSEALKNNFSAVHTLVQLAQIAVWAGDRGRAAAHWRRALVLAEELGSSAITVFCLAGIAGLLSARQRHEPAVRLLAAGDRLRQAVAQQPGTGPQFQAAYAHALSTTQAALSPGAFAQAWAAGLALPLDQAADLALAELAFMPPPTTRAGPAGV